jgi:alanine racemase
MIVNAPIAEIHLDNIRANFELARNLSEAKLMPVIKADAYGHGATEVAATLSDADAFAVARVSEAVQLRKNLSNKPIVVLEGYLGEKECAACVEYELVPTVHSDYQLALLPNDLPYWLKFNTGMFRLGFQPERAAELAARVPGDSLVGISSHFANADVQAHPLNAEQQARFEAIARSFPGVPQCFANSAAVLAGRASELDWVRPGVMLYGGAPNGVHMPELKAGMSLRAPIIAVNELSQGDQVGYGGIWQADKACRVAVVALGYADGYPREMPSGTPVLINGDRRTLVGRVSMDMCTVLLEDHDAVQAGDWATFWGETLPIDEIATSAGTISYTLMVGQGARVQRTYRS